MAIEDVYRLPSPRAVGCQQLPAALLDWIYAYRIDRAEAEPCVWGCQSVPAMVAAVGHGEHAARDPRVERAPSGIGGGERTGRRGEHVCAVERGFVRECPCEPNERIDRREASPVGIRGIKGGEVERCGRGDAIGPGGPGALAGAVLAHVGGAVALRSGHGTIPGRGYGGSVTYAAEP